jgi:putative transposase
MSRACRMLKISRQAVHQYQRRHDHRQAQVFELLPRIRALRQLMPRVGGRKLLKHLPDIRLGRDKFFEILRNHGLLVKRRRKYAITTNSKHTLPVYPNLLPEAAVDAPNQIWVADQTYIRLRRGFCYLSLLTDFWSRKIVGYDVSPTLEASGPLNALRMALDTVHNPAGLIHHSDRGKQYCSSEYTQTLKEHGCRSSMTAPRRPDQNATAERINGILKSEFYLDATFNCIEDAHRAIVQSIYIYNNIRLHLSLGFSTPSLKHAA